MSIQDHYDKAITVERLTPIEEGSSKKEYTEHLTNVDCQIRPLDPSMTQSANSFGKNKLMFCAVVDIVEGDRIIDGSDTYKVAGIEVYEDLSQVNDHLEIMIGIFKSKTPTLAILSCKISFFIKYNKKTDPFQRPV